MYTVTLGKPIDIVRGQTTEVQLPFCCDTPEPAYLFGVGSEPGTRSQGIDCISCNTPLVRLTWTPPRPSDPDVIRGIERVTGEQATQTSPGQWAWKPGMPIPDEPGPPPVK